jgi:glycosyltransferase involved in cell wall biosynthesis
MKIAFVYDVIYPYVKGGVEKRIHELALRLASRGHDVHIIGMKYWEGPDSLRVDGITLHGICPARPLYAQGRRTIREAVYFSTRLLPFLMQEEFDIIDCQQFPYLPCFPAWIASLVRKKPLVITWHEVWGDYWYDYLGRKGVFGKAAERLVARLTPFRIAVSGITAKKLEALGTGGDVRIIANGIDLCRIGSIPPSAESSDIIFVGRLIREKHGDVLVRAFALALKKSPDLTLLILGDGPEKGAIAALVRDLGIGDRVTLKPFLATDDEVIGLLKASHICAIPSTREGFGIAALEALACGLPVVTIDHPDNAIRELITENTGFVTSLSAETLAETIGTALARYPSMKTACKESAGNYEWDGIADRAEEYYRAVIGQARR